MIKTGEAVKLIRDTEVVQIPEGYKVRLARGTEVRLMQSLGGTYTVMTEYHTMVRIDGQDADAIGLEPVKTAGTEDTAGTEGTAGTVLTADETRERVWGALRSVFDPEIPVNVVDLGLVYKNVVTPLEVSPGYKVSVDMTLTAPGCGMGNVLKEDAERRIKSLPGVKEVDVQMVVDPPWNQDMMSEAAKLELGL